MKWSLFFILLASAAHALEPEECLARVLYNEAHGESWRGQLLVAETVMNRVADPRFPDTVCRVVAQTGQFVNGPPLGNYDAEYTTAVLVLEEELRLPTTGALYFHSGPRPSYLRGKELVAEEGRHRFYR